VSRPRITRREWAWLSVIVAAGFVLRVWFLRVHAVIERDGTLFASVAESLARTGRLIDFTGATHAWFPPGYPALMVPLVLATGSAELGGRLTSLAAALATIVVVFLIGRRLASSPAGLLAAALTALYPALLQWSVSVHSESANALAICGVTLLALRVLERPGWLAIGALGALVGGAYLVRGEGLLLAATFVWIAGAWRWRGERWPVVTTRAVVFAAPVAIMVLPYVVYLHAVLGTWTLSGKLALHTALARWPQLGYEALVYSPDRPALPAPGAWARLVADLERYARNAIPFEGMLVESASLLVIALAAITVFAWLQPPRDVARGVFGCAFVPILIYPFFLVEPKWLEPFMPLVFVLTAQAVILLASLAPPRSRWIVVAGLAALLILRWSPRLIFPLRYTPAFEEVEQRWAGEWVRQHLGAKTTLMSRGPVAGYYAGARWVPLPLTDLAGVRAVARREGVTVLVLDELLIRRHRPSFVPLLFEPPPPWLTLVHEFDPFPARRVRIFTLARDVEGGPANHPDGPPRPFVPLE
jgi:4-amino-4-deoxy-L-arabinose transferase-like glycosyltransferase